MVTAYLQMLRNWKDFSGRTSRRDYWMAYLGNLVVAVIIGVVMGIITGIGTIISEDLGAVLSVITSIVSGIYGLIVLIPGIAIGVRRLHDQGKSGMVYVWCMLGNLCCGLGGLVFLVFMCLPGTPGPNQFGNPTGIMPNSMAGMAGMGYGQQNMYGQQPNNNYGQQPNNNYGQNGYNNNQY